MTSSRDPHERTTGFEPATLEPDTWDATRERLVGGTLRLTELGEWWLSAPEGQREPT